MMKSFPPAVLLISLTIALSGCKRPPAAFAPPPPAEVTVDRPVLRTVPDTLEFTGQTRGFEVVELRARVRGFLAKKHVQGGARVKAGDLLFTIDPRTFQAVIKSAQAEVAAREAALKLAEVTLERTRQAIAANAVAQQELDRAQAERDAAVAQVDLAKAALRTAELDLEFTQVRAPIDGRLGIINLDEGQLVGANEATLLATIINDSQIWAEYDISERDLLELRSRYNNRRPGEDGRPDLPVELAQANDTGFPFKGRYAMGDNTINPTTGTVRIRAIFDNPTGAIIPGAFVRLRALFENREVMLLPDSAVLRDQSGAYVLTVDQGGKVARKDVNAGALIERMRVVAPIVGAASPLTVSDQVITVGIQRARPGAVVKAVPARPAAAPLGNSLPPPLPPPASGGPSAPSDAKK
ncbi:MAG: efflux RND transporter periplasmic adaptor subunit [bacterium]|jgi:RND family efflux transporter MFP subunit|nr:efflux RND transporter periplasmic adaptor subunit [Planctomycetaceae bacterium]